MNEQFYQLLLNGHAIFLVLIKVSLLMKYVLFRKYKEPNWKLQHIVFFGENEIAFSSCYKMAKAKKFQNHLSIAIAHLGIMVVLVRFSLIAFK